MTAHLCYEFDRLPPEPVRLAVCDWLRTHGINPNDVAVPGWIERRPATYQVAYQGYEWETDDDGSPRPRLTDDRSDAIRRERVLQLEARPLPFPRVAAEHDLGGGAR